MRSPSNKRERRGAFQENERIGILVERGAEIGGKERRKRGREGGGRGRKGE